MRWRSVLAAASLALLTFLAFSNSFSAGFILDNKALLLQDPRIRELTGENIRLILQHTYWWPSGEAGLYRPFTTLSYLFNYAVLGNAHEPAGYHWINFLLHLGNVFLVYALARRLLREFWPSFFAAALWAVHPVLTESVTNMIGRSDLLSAMAVLSGFLMYLKGTESAGIAQARMARRIDGRHRRWRFFERERGRHRGGDCALRTDLVERAKTGPSPAPGVHRHASADRGDAVSALDGAGGFAARGVSFHRQPHRGRRLLDRTAHGNSK